MLRKFQSEIKAIANRIANGEHIRYIYADVTQGGGKSSVAALLNSELPDYKICWVVPRDSLRLQGEASYADPDNKKRYGNTDYLRAAANEENPTRGMRGYITTYQSIIVAPELHKAEIESERYILILDECHHVSDPNSIECKNDDPSIAEEDKKGKAYYSAIAPLVERAKLIVFMSGSMERHENEKLAFIPYRSTQDGQLEAIDTSPREGWAFVEYRRPDAIDDGAVLGFTIVAHDGPVEWTDNGDGRHCRVDLLSRARKDQRSGALSASLEGDLAKDVIISAFEDWKATKASYPPAKMLVIARDIQTAKQYHDFIWELGASVRIVSDASSESGSEESKGDRKHVGIATSANSKEARRNIRHFRGELAPECNILVSVAMAYEGLDVPQITHVVCLTRYRSKPWIEQAITRCNRIDYGGLKKGFNKPSGRIFALSDAEMLDLISRIDNGVPKVIRHEIGSPENLFPKQAGISPATYTHICSKVTSFDLYVVDGTNEKRLRELRDKVKDNVAVYEEFIKALRGNATSTIDERRLSALGSLDAIFERLVETNKYTSSANPAKITPSEKEDALDRQIDELVSKRAGRNHRRKIRLLAFLKREYGESRLRTIEDRLRVIAYLQGRDASEASITEAAS